jgi:hypothetical protein
MRTFLPGSVFGLIITGVLLTVLNLFSVSPEPSPPIQEVGALQPIGGEADDEAIEEKKVDQSAPRRRVSAPKPLVIREPRVDAEATSGMTGLVSPTRARCRLLVGGCMLEMDFQNRTNGFISNVDVSYELSGSGNSIRKGYVIGGSERLAPKAIATAVDRINDISLGSYDLTHCIEVFDWFSDQADLSSEAFHPGGCTTQKVQIEP